MLKKYLPIRIFSIQFGYGWWWGSYFFFLGRHDTAFAILPMYAHFTRCTYKNGKAIDNGDTESWSNSRQQELREDKARQAKALFDK